MSGLSFGSDDTDVGRVICKSFSESEPCIKQRIGVIVSHHIAESIVPCKRI